MRLISRSARFRIVAGLLVGTALFLQVVHARAGIEFVPPRIALASFPVELKNWAGVDVPIPDEILRSLGPGEFLQRTYSNHTAGDPAVDLYIAYLPNRPALYHHLPKDCLEGSGWSPVESGITTVTLSGDTAFPANRYLIAKGDDRQLVLFWYSDHGRRVASETRMDFYLAADALRLNRTDNALVRLNTELRPGEKPDDAERRLLAFVGMVNPLLNDYIPR
jgi:EpsI family protein